MLPWFPEQLTLLMKTLFSSLQLDMLIFRIAYYLIFYVGEQRGDRRTGTQRRRGRDEVNPNFLLKLSRMSPLLILTSAAPSFRAFSNCVILG
jgi:hypothetical protein